MSEMTQSPDILAALDVHKYYGRGLARMHVLRGVNLSVRRGEFLAIMGPSGCGKSTLLHVLGLMTPAEEGSQVLLDGVALPEDEHGRTHLRRTQIGFVFQRFNLLGVLDAPTTWRFRSACAASPPTGGPGSFSSGCGSPM